MPRFVLLLFLLCLLAISARAEESWDREEWLSIHLFDQRVGYSRFRARTSEEEQDGNTVVRRETWRDMVYRRGRDQTATQERTVTLRRADTGELLKREMVTTTGGGGFLQTVQTFAGGRIRVAVRALDSEGRPLGPEKVTERDIPAESPGKAAAFDDLQAAGFRVGDVRSFDAHDAERGESYTGTVQVRSRTLLRLGRREVAVAVVEQLERTSSEERRTILWLEEDGTPVRILNMDTGVRVEWSTREEAVRMDDAADALRLAAAALDAPLPRPADLTELRVRFRLVRPEGTLPRFLEDERQAVERQGNRLQVTVRAAELDGLDEAGPADAGDPLEPYLRPGVLVESDAPALVAACRQALEGETRPWAATQRLVRWVFENIRQKSFAVDRAGALETLQGGEGDCTEHSLLFAALARAAGLPTRLAVGLAYDGDRHFYWHQWNEVHVGGRWIPVDPSTGRTDLGCGYLRTWHGAEIGSEMEGSSSGMLAAEVVGARVGTGEIARTQRPERSRLVGSLFVDPDRRLQLTLPEGWEGSAHRPQVPGLLGTFVDPSEPRGMAMVIAMPTTGSLDRTLEDLESGLRTASKDYQRLSAGPVRVGGLEGRRLEFSGSGMQWTGLLVPWDDEVICLVGSRQGALRQRDPALHALLSSVARVDLEKLARDLGGFSEGERFASAVVLGLMGDRRALEPLVRDLEAEMAAARPRYGRVEPLAMALASLDPESALPLLERLAHSENLDARIVVLRPLAACGSAEALAVLIGLLEEEGPVGQLASEALAETDRARVIESLRVLPDLEQRRGSLLPAARTLGEMGAAEPLARWARHSDPQVRRAGVAGIAHLRSTELDAVLATALQDPEPDVRAEAMESLRARLEEDQDRLDPKWAAPLAGALAGDAARAGMAATLMGRVEGAEAIRWLAGLSGHPELYRRLAAVTALGGRRDEGTRAALMRASRDPSPMVRAVAALGLMEFPEAVPTLMGLMMGDPSPPVRASAAAILAEMDHPAADRAVARLLSGPAADRRRAVEPLLVLLDDRLAPRLEPLARDPSRDVRRALAEALAWEEALWNEDRASGDPRRLPAMRRLLRDSDRQVRLAALKALSGDLAADRGVADLLRTLLDDPDAEVRHRAQLALIRSPAGGSLEERLAAAADLPEEEGYDLLWSFSDRAALKPALVGLLMDSPEPRVAVLADVLVLDPPGPTELVPLLEHPRASVRAVAARCWPRSVKQAREGAEGTARARQAMHRLLADPDEGVRAATVKALAEAGEPGLEWAFRDTSSRVRVSAFEALEADPESLRRGLVDLEPTVRRAARQAVSRAARTASEQGDEAPSLPEDPGYWADRARRSQLKGDLPAARQALEKALERLAPHQQVPWDWVLADPRPEARGVGIEDLCFDQGGGAALTWEGVLVRGGSSWEPGAPRPQVGVVDDILALEGRLQGRRLWVSETDESGDWRLWRYDLDTDLWHLAALDFAPWNESSGRSVQWAIPHGDRVWLFDGRLWTWRPGDGSHQEVVLGVALPGSRPVCRGRFAWFTGRDGIVRLDLESGAVVDPGVPATPFEDSEWILAPSGEGVWTLRSHDDDVRLFHWEPGGAWQEIPVPDPIREAGPGSLWAEDDSLWVVTLEPDMVVRYLPAPNRWQIHLVPLSDGKSRVLEAMVNEGRVYVHHGTGTLSYPVPPAPAR